MEIGRKKSETSQPTSTKNKKYQNTCKVNLQTKKKKKIIHTLTRLSMQYDQVT